MSVLGPKWRQPQTPHGEERRRHSEIPACQERSRAGRKRHVSSRSGEAFVLTAIYDFTFTFTATGNKPHLCQVCDVV